MYKSEGISNDSWGHETRNPYQILPFKFNTYHAIIKGHYFVLILLKNSSPASRFLDEGRGRGGLSQPSSFNLSSNFFRGDFFPGSIPLEGWSYPPQKEL